MWPSLLVYTFALEVKHADSWRTCVWTHVFTCSWLCQNKDIPIENTTDCLSTMASICRVMIDNPYVIVIFWHFFLTGSLCYFCWHWTTTASPMQQELITFSRLVNEATEGWGQGRGQKVWGWGQKFYVRPRLEHTRPRPVSNVLYETYKYITFVLS